MTLYFAVLLLELQHPWDAVAVKSASVGDRSIQCVEIVHCIDRWKSLVRLNNKTSVYKNRHFRCLHFFQASPPLRVPDEMGFSIFTTFCCCLCLGIPAMILSSQVNAYTKFGIIPFLLDTAAFIRLRTRVCFAFLKLICTIVRSGQHRVPVQWFSTGWCWFWLACGSLSTPRIHHNESARQSVYPLFKPTSAQSWTYFESHRSDS